MKEYSIVIPVYNEADKISATLTQIVKFMSEFCESFEVIVVDDGSSDATVAAVELYAQENPNVSLIKNPHKGKGVAIWTGVMHAEGQYIYLCDADLSAAISEIKKLAIWVKEHNFDIVIASREGAGSRRVGEPLYRHIMGRIFNFFVRFLAISGVKDTQCGFKLFKANVAKQIFSKLRVYNPQSRVLDAAYVGAFDVEVLFLARRMGFTIKEVPVTWTFVKTMRISPFSDSLKMLRDVVKIRYNGIRNLYK